MDGILKKDSGQVGYSISSRHFQRTEHDVLRRYIFYQTSWPLFRCQHDQATPYLPPEFSGLQQNEVLRRRYDYQKRLDEEKNAKKSREKKTKSATRPVSIPAEAQNRKRSSNKKTLHQDRIESANSLYLLDPDLWTCSSYRYTTPYGHLYELRKINNEIGERKGHSLWLWEDDYHKWLEKKGTKDSNLSFAGDSRCLKMPRTSKSSKPKTTGKQRPHADVYAKFFEKNISKQKRKQIIMTVEKIARGWLTRVTLKRLSRKAQIHHKQTLAGLMQEYKDLIGRLRMRCDFPVNNYNLNLANIEDYMNRKLLYDVAFTKVANEDNKLSLQNIKSFFCNCRLYPTNKDIQMVIKKISQSSRNRHDFIVLLENSSRLSERTLSEIQELLEIFVSALDLDRFRTRIGIATYTGGLDEVCGIGQTRDNSKLLQLIKEIKPKSGHPYLSQAFKRIQRTMQDFPRPWCQQICLLITGGGGLNREDSQEEAMKIRKNGADIVIIGVDDHVKTEESQQMVSCRDLDFRFTNYENIQDLMTELLNYLFPTRQAPDMECFQREYLNKSDALEVLWTLYPPKGVGLTGVKKSRWIRPVIDGEDAWSLLDDEILNKADLKSCLRLVVKSTLEREGFISIPSKDPAGVTKVTDVETALEQMEDYLQEKKRESRQKARSLQDDVE